MDKEACADAQADLNLFVGRTCQKVHFLTLRFMYSIQSIDQCTVTAMTRLCERAYLGIPASSSSGEKSVTQTTRLNFALKSTNQY